MHDESAELAEHAGAPAHADSTVHGETGGRAAGSAVSAVAVAC